ncbi:recombinase family protein [Nocardioides alkalitolerans]|uniref:recombinase family protein n=1 Tax=Nocardioides alkalitolerans TaxID=281714 RepID=UPI0003F59C85|nr:recombinase family protein [Nocardioides alkalitolerans]
MTLNVSIYVRLSEDEHGTSLGVARQEEACRRHAEAHGWRVHSVHIDNDLSATTGVRRPAFERLLASEPEAILVWHTDRLVRLSKELERVIDLGINVYAVQTGHVDLSTPAGRAVAKTVTAWAQYEGEQKAERQKLAARQRAVAGKPWWPTRPFGFEMGGGHREDEAAALREAYRGLLRGFSLARVVRDLNAAGHATNKGRAWTAPTFRSVLLNARNAGIRVYRGEEIGPASWSPIVTEEEFRAVVHLLNEPKRFRNGGRGGKGRRENLLTGLATCGKCGGPIRAAWRGTRGEEGAYKVYQCGGKHCVSHPTTWVDGRVMLELTKRSEQWVGMVSEAKDDAAHDVPALQAREAALQHRKAELAEMFADGTIDRATFTAGVERVGQEATAVAAELREAVNAIYGSDISGDLEALADFYAGDVEEVLLPSGKPDPTVAYFDVDRVRGVVERMCEEITLHPIGKGRKVRQYGDHLRITFREMR